MKNYAIKNKLKTSCSKGLTIIRTFLKRDYLCTAHQVVKHAFEKREKHNESIERLQNVTNPKLTDIGNGRDSFLINGRPSFFKNMNICRTYENMGKTIPSVYSVTHEHQWLKTPYSEATKTVCTIPS